MNFHYKVRSEDGRIVTGVGQAVTRDLLVKQLKKQGMRPIAVMPANADDLPKAQADAAERGTPEVVAKRKKSVLNTAIGKPVKDEEVLMFTRDLYSFFRSGVPLVSGIRDITLQMKNVNFAEILEDIAERINGGSRLSDAFAAHPRVFSEFYVNSIRAGEHAGRLEDILNEIIRTMDRDIELKQTVSTATRYPLIVMTFLMGAFAFIVSVVIPKISKIFERYRSELPIPTRVVISTGEFMQNNGPLLLAVLIVTVISIVLYKRTPQGRLLWDLTMLKVPVFGVLNNKVAVTRFAGTLKTLYKSGVVLPDALDITSRVVGNEIIAKSARDAAEGTRRGKLISDTLRGNPFFLPLATRMIITGEKTGNLDGMLAEVEATYEREIKFMLSKLTTLLEPMLTIILGLMVMVLALGVFLPMWRMLGLIGGH